MIMKRKTIIGSGIVLIGMLASGLAASVAWFLAGENTFKTDVNGSVVEEYFHCGSGTQEDPFVITRPMHYYHLVEFFQRKTVLPVSQSHNVTFGTDYLYFQIGYDFDENSDNGIDLEVYDYENDGTYSGTTSKILNMSYFSGDNALMPIGTSECPFFGSFDGGGLNDGDAITVQNLNIKSQEDVIVEGGSSLTTRYTSDVGMFGYVADNDGDSHTTSIKNLYIDGLNIDLTGAVAGKDAVDAESVSHTSEHDGKIYVGYIVGHMYTYTRYDSSGPTDSSPIYDVYVNNATIEGGADATCNFGYVGHADEINGVSGDAIDISDIINNLAVAAGGGEQGEQWGGSINMRSLNNRIWNLLNAPNNVSTDDPSINHPTVSTASPSADVALQPAGKTYASYYDYHRYYYDDYNYVSVENAISETKYNNRNPETITNIYRLAGNGTYSIYHKDDANKKKIDVPGTALPLAVGDKSDGYPVANKNTGYIVGGMAGGTGAYTGQTTIRVASSPLGKHIGNSLSSAGRDSTSYVKSQLEVITTNNPGNYSSSNFTRIQDKYNSANTSVSSTLSAKYNTRGVLSKNLAKYDSSRDQIDEVLSGQSFAHGLHFTGSSISSGNTFSFPSALINGSTYTNFAMPKNSIDFNLKQKGYINFFAGSYQHNTETACDSFFSLHVVRRNEQNAISSISEISKVYENTNSATNTEFPYVYQFTNNTYYAGNKDGVDVAFTKGSTVVFDMQYLWNAPQVAYAVYYFEVPVNSGEFAMGSHAGNANGTYLFYLDLATSGGDEEELDYNGEHMVSNDPIFTQIEYTSSGHVINSCFNIAYVVPAGATKETFSITVSRSGTVFSVQVVNTTANVFTLHVLLVDNDSNPDNDYPYTYTLKYNTGAVSTPYTSSGSYQGAASGTQLVSLLT